MQRGDPLDSIGMIRGDRQILFSSRRVNESWSHSVDCYVVLAPLDGKAFRQVRDAGFGHAINAFSRKRGKSRLRTHVDDAAVFLADHDSAHSLAGEKRSF